MLWLTCCFDVLCLGRLDSEGRFVTGSYDKQLITWHMERSQPESVIEGLRVTDLAVSQDGTRLVLVTPDKKIKMYSLPSMSHIPRAIPQVLNCLLMRTCTLAMPLSLRCSHTYHAVLLLRYTGEVHAHAGKRRYEVRESSFPAEAGQLRRAAGFEGD